MHSHPFRLLQVAISDQLLQAHAHRKHSHHHHTPPTLTQHKQLPSTAAQVHNPMSVARPSSKTIGARIKEKEGAFKMADHVTVCEHRERGEIEGLGQMGGWHRLKIRLEPEKGYIPANTILQHIEDTLK